jgi:hypothetical protein
MAVEAITGAEQPTLIVDPHGHAARFDGMYPGNYPGTPHGAKKDYDRLRNKVFQVEPTSPQNSAQEAKELARLEGKEAEWNREAIIANQCGYQMQVAITDSDLVKRLNQSHVSHPGFQIIEGHLGGTFGQVRANTVGGEVHHMPSNDASPLSKNEGPAIWTEIPHHNKTKSNGRNGNEGRAYRAKQHQQILNGQPERALADDIEDIQTIAPGLYNIPIQQMRKKMKQNNTIQQMKQKAKLLQK